MAVGPPNGAYVVSIQFASGKRALGICDRCGQTYKLKKLHKETVNLVQTNLKVCPECWDGDHPQNQLGRYPVFDPQALEESRSDSSELEASRELTVPGGGSVEDYIAEHTST